MLLVKGVTLPATAFWAAFAHDWLLWFGVLFVVFASEILPKVRFAAAVDRSFDSYPFRFRLPGDSRHVQARVITA